MYFQDRSGITTIELSALPSSQKSGRDSSRPWVAAKRKISVLFLSNLDYKPLGKKLFLPLFLFKVTQQAHLKLHWCSLCFKVCLKVVRNGKIIGYGKPLHLPDGEQAYSKVYHRFLTKSSVKYSPHFWHCSSAFWQCSALQHTALLTRSQQEKLQNPFWKHFKKHSHNILSNSFLRDSFFTNEMLIYK